MRCIVPVLCGVVGAAVAGRTGFGYGLGDLNFYLICIPFWILGGLINA